MDLTGLGSVATFASKVVDKISAYFPDPAQKAAALLEIRKLDQTGELAQLAADTDLMKGQLEINKVEAASTNWFIAGWRPGFGWIGVFAIGYSYVILPFAEFLLYIYADQKTIEQFSQLPHIDLGALWPLITGMLGIGAARTFEKIKGAEGNR